MSLNLMRQQDFIQVSKLKKAKVSIIGAGAIGSFVSLTLTKMGVEKIRIWDEDGVTDHNIPNQFYRIKDINDFKVEALKDIILDFSQVKIMDVIKFYSNQSLYDTVIVATDSMHSRRLVWNQYKKQSKCINFIDARMGAELGKIYTITKKDSRNIKFYESRLHSDEEAVQLRCTAKSIIYNVLMISSLVCRAYKAILNNEKIPRELIFNMQEINKASFMTTN